MKYTAQELALKTNSLVFGNPNRVVEEIIFDSRLIFSSHHNAFITLKTSRNNGANYINEAIAKGIKVIITEEKPHEIGELTWIITPDTKQFLRLLAKNHLQNLTLKTIGITGSNGKTIVKEWLYQCLWNEMKVVKSPKSFNSQIGLPLSLLQASQEDELGLFEVGISKPGEMQLQAEIFKPEIGVFTHLGSAHSEYFENEEQKLAEKLKLFENAHTIIYNGDNEIVKKTINKIYSNRKLISYGLSHDNQVFIDNPLDQKEAFNIRLQDDTTLKIPFSKRDNATFHNALAVIATLHELGIASQDIIDKINNLRAVEMRMEAIEGSRNNIIINDSYNLDLDSLKIALETSAQYQKSKKVLVITDVLSVKEKAENLYRNVAELVNQQQFYHIFLIGKEIIQFKYLFNAPTSIYLSLADLQSSRALLPITDALILLKGARKFELEQLKKDLALQSHDTILEVNLDTLLHNINIHKSFLKPSTKVMAMVKANAYGLGAYEVAEFLQHHNIDYLTVAYADEGAALRQNNITLPIMVMNPEMSSYATIIDYQLEPEIYSFQVLDLFIDALQSKGIQKPYPIHIKLETGMHRLGFRREDLDELIHKIKHNNLYIASILSHLATADDPDEEAYVLSQIKVFEENTQLILSKLDYHPLLHILNSAGITNFPQYQMDMVRIGIGMIGYSANPKIKPMLEPVVSFKTIITQLAKLNSGESVGYNRKFIAEKPTTIATIAVGYADGISRRLGNGRGVVGIKGQLFPIRGNVCMDMLMVDVGNSEVKVGDEVVIFNGNPSLEELSQRAETIPYEILTSISRRVKRIYIKN